MEQTLRRLHQSLLQILTPYKLLLWKICSSVWLLHTGMILAARTLLDSNSNPTREDVIEAISGNICRCTGYEPIIEAILAVAEKEVEK